jgi:hypothetical protein
VPSTSLKSYGYRAYTTSPATVVTQANPIFGQRFTTSQYVDPAENCGADALDDWVHDDPTAGMNNRLHTFVFEGHGGAFGFGNEGSGRRIFYIDQLAATLTNDLFSFMMFICCQTGWMDHSDGDCEAEAFINLAGEGAIGVVASTRDSWSSAFGVVDRNILRALHQHLATVMGKAVMEAKLSTSTLMFRRQYNLYGDPALDLWPTGEYTLTGTASFSENVTIPANTTLTILPGTTLNFAPGKSLIVYGRLNAVGTPSSRIVFTSSSTSTKWAGILVSGSGANNSTIKHAIIERVQTYGGSALSVIGATGFLLDSCYIRNNTTYSTLGVVFTNAGSPEVRGTRIHGNGGYGIKYSNTSGYLYADSIVSNTGGGVKCSNGSNVLFGKIGFPAYNGNSRISGGSYGVYAEANSNPTIGTYQSSYYGYNSITATTTARVYASNSGALAEMNWWGANPPQASWFVTSNGAIDWNPCLTSNPFGTMLVPSPGPEPNAKVPASLALAPADVDPLSEVRNARLRGDYSEALGLLSKISVVPSDGHVSLRYVGELLAFGHFQFDPRLISLAEKVVEVMGQGTWEELTLARLLEIGGMPEKAEAIFKELSSDAKDPEIQQEAALALFFSCFQTQRFSEAEGILSDRSSRWGEDEAGAYGRWLMSIVGDGEVNKPAVLPSSVNEEAPGEMELASYPNPFNPLTTIRFSLPHASHVKLTVYNTLGERVSTLVDEEKAAGVHNVRFDASSLASGVYLYRVGGIYSVHHAACLK